MSDQCQNCIHKGDLKACESEPCTIHESWYVSSLQQQNTALQQQVKELQAEKSRYSMSAGAADQFRAEALASREALGFSCESDCVSPSDISSAIAELKAAAIRDALDSLKDRPIHTHAACVNHLEEYAANLSSKGGD